MPIAAFDAFEDQLKTLCLQEFPCGLGKWVSGMHENNGCQESFTSYNQDNTILLCNIRVLA